MKRAKALSPNSHLTLLCRKGFSDPFVRSGLVDRAIEVHKKDPKNRQQIYSILGQQEFDLLLSPHQSFRTAWLVRKIKVKGPKIGFRRWWDIGSYSHRIQKPELLPDALRQLSLLAPVDRELSSSLEKISLDPAFQNSKQNSSRLDFVNSPIPSWARMEIGLGEGFKSELESLPPDLIKAVEGAILLAPGSVWATKRWTLESYIELAKKLIQQGHKVALMGGPDEVSICAELKKVVPEVRDFSGKTNLSQALLLLNRARLLVCNDSGAAHMAAAVSLPVVSIFGPTTLAQGFRPWTDQLAVIQKDLSCRPCGRHGGHRCPLGTHECMKSIKSEEVLKAVQKLASANQL